MNGRSLWLLLMIGAVEAAEVPPQDLLFMSSAHGKSDLFVHRAGEPEWRQLTDDPAGANWGVWSPDGQRIVFQSRRNGKFDLYLIRADGSDLQQLTHHEDHDYLPSWTPDGEHIVFVSWRDRDRRDDPPHLFVIDADGGGLDSFMERGLGTSSGIEWAPDGSRFVLTRKTGDGGGDLFLVDPRDHSERQLTDDADYKGSAVFSPDGGQLAYYRSNEDGSWIEILDLADGDVRQVVAEGWNWYPRYSTDGGWLLFSTRVGPEADDNLEIFMIRLDRQGPPMPLITGGGRQAEGSWRP